MMTLDNATAMWIVAQLYLVLPLTTWVALSGKSNATATLWCIGGLMGGIGLILIGGRGTLPHVLAYHLGNSLFIGSFLVRTHAWRLELGHSHAGCVRSLWVWFILDAVLFALLDGWGTEFSLSVYLRTMQLLAASVFVAQTWQVSKQDSSGHARAIAVVYGGVALLFLSRLVKTFDPDFPGVSTIYASHQSQGVVLASAFSGVLSAVVGHFSFVALMLQSTMRKQADAAAQRARQEEVQRHGQQLAHLVRQHSLGVVSESLSKELLSSQKYSGQMGVERTTVPRQCR